MKRLLLVLVLCLAAVPLAAQTAATQSQLRLVVVDETGAGIPNADDRRDAPGGCSRSP